jgi:glycosyltransferase involved in cell wall biosynthesis
MESATGRLCWLSDASDEMLGALYRQCRGMVVASYAEGFGLPLEEAGRLGKPILARDLSVYRETGRSGNLTTFGHDRDLADAIREWDRDIGHSPAAAPAPPVGWDTTLSDLLAALRITGQAEVRLGAAA